MLGVGTWFAGIMVPTVCVGGFIASRKRLAYQWREELMDPEGNIYPATTDADMQYFRRVSSSSPTVGNDEQMKAKNNIGLHVCPDGISVEEKEVLLDEVARWIPLFGQPIDQRKLKHLEEEVCTGTTDSSADKKLSLFDVHLYSKTSIISDHAEDIQLMKAPWGTGDRIQPELMPASLRFLVQRTQNTFERLGRLRHVYIEYSPCGKFYHVPRPTKSFDGHDYVIIPLRRDNQATVATFSPLMRSRHSILKEVLENSWTSRDIDAMIPPCSMLRVYGSARYEWGWGIRPGDVWFGHYRNALHSLSPSGEQGLFGRLGKLVSVYRGGSDEVIDTKKEAALVVLHFEGPRDAHKKRSLLLQPERLIFGSPPTPESYEQWSENRPTADSVAEEGVVRFLLKNYFEMLRVS